MVRIRPSRCAIRSSVRSWFDVRGEGGEPGQGQGRGEGRRLEEEEEKEEEVRARARERQRQGQQTHRVVILMGIGHQCPRTQGIVLLLLREAAWPWGPRNIETNAAVRRVSFAGKSTNHCRVRSSSSSLLQTLSLSSGISMIFRNIYKLDDEMR